MPESIDFDDYVEILRTYEKEIYETELMEDQQDAIGANYSKIWDVTDIGRNGYNFFDEFFRKDFPFTARNHFIRKPDDRKGNPDIPIKAKFLVHMLLYIGVAYPKGITQKKLNTESKRADILYKEFRDLNDKKNTSDNSVVSVSDDGQQLINEDKFKTLITNLVHKFYSLTEQGEFLAAIELLNPFEDKKYFKGQTDYRLFKSMYSVPRSPVSKLAVFNISRRFETEGVAHVYFEVVMDQGSDLPDKFEKNLFQVEFIGIEDRWFIGGFERLRTM